MEDLQIIIDIIVPLITGAAGWFVGRKKRNNDFLVDLQSNIDLLADKNKTLMEEVIQLREENCKLKIEIRKVKIEIENIKKEKEKEKEKIN